MRIRCAVASASLLLLAAVLGVYADTAATVRSEPALPQAMLDDPELAGRTRLLFRAMDSDHDKLITRTDAEQSVKLLNERLPGVSLDQFASFIQTGDKNGDGALSMQEFVDAFSAGVAQAKLEDASPAPASSQQQQQQQGAVKPTEFRFAEVSTESKEKARGINTANAGVVRALRMGNRAAAAWIKAQQIDRSQDACIMCQYLVERVESNLRFSGIVIPDTLPTVASPAVGSVVLTPSIPLPVAVAAPAVVPLGGLPVPALTAVRVPAVPLTPLAAVLSAHAMPSPFVGLMETDARSTVETMANTGGMAPPGRISGWSKKGKETHAKLVKVVNRFKYGRIQKIMDLTMDDVCERGTPSAYYGYCKHFFKVEKDVVEGLAHMFHSSDICLRVGMCGRRSYITMGLHTRYK